MKKLLFAVVAFSLLATISSIAEPTHQNEVGLYMTPDGLGATGTYYSGNPVMVYLVLTRPTDSATGTPYGTINAFECQLNFNPVGNLFKLADVLPSFSLNVGNTNDIGQGFLEYIVGIDISNPLIVTDESVVLITFTFLQWAPGVIEVTLGPVHPRQSIPDEMALQSVSGELRVMYSMGGSHDAPVFIFDGDAVAVENESFGSVKALYR